MPLECQGGPAGCAGRVQASREMALSPGRARKNKLLLRLRDVAAVAVLVISSLGSQLKQSNRQTKPNQYANILKAPGPTNRITFAGPCLLFVSKRFPRNFILAPAEALL